MNFLHYTSVTADNNHAERMVRNGIVMRKNSYCNRSRKGAQTQAILMSFFATLKQRGHNPTQTIIDALKTRLTTGKLPPLPNYSSLQ
ncbi:MAG: transposase [Planctomycetia bacterium]|nr:transposase [Planctomycetia bacterium]